MKKERVINIRGVNHNLVFRKYRQAKRLKISIYSNGAIFVTIPCHVPYFLAEKMVLQKSDWIAEKIREIGKKENRRFSLGGSAGEYAKLKKEALALARKKVEKFSRIYGLETGRISIRNQRTRWGSCSAKGNLSFNYKIALLPDIFSDYIVVHEICHRKEFNHSERFWILVAKTIPSYKSIRKEMKNL